MDFNAVYKAQDNSLEDMLARSHVNQGVMMQVARELEQRKQADQSFGLQQENARENRALREQQQKSLDDDRAQRGADRQTALDTAKTGKFYASLALRKKGDLVTGPERVQFAQEGLNGNVAAAAPDQHDQGPHFHFTGTAQQEDADARQAAADARDKSTLAHQQSMERIAQQNANTAQNRANTAGDAGGDHLDEGGLEAAATSYRILGQSSIPTRVGEQDRIHIMNAAAAQGKALGQSPVQTIQKQAAYKSDAAALTKMQTMASAASAYESKAQQQAGIVLDLSGKVARTNMPVLNNWLLSGKADVAGDPTTAAYFNAITTFSSEYAKIMEGSTGSVAASSDSARKAAERLIHAGQSPAQISAVVNLMRKEMQLTLDGYGATIDHITNRMTGQPAAAPVVPATSTAPGVAPAAPTDSAARAAALLKKYGGG